VCIRLIQNSSLEFFPKGFNATPAYPCKCDQQETPGEESASEPAPARARTRNATVGQHEHGKPVKRADQTCAQAKADCPRASAEELWYWDQWAGGFLCSTCFWEAEDDRAQLAKVGNDGEDQEKEQDDTPAEQEPNANDKNGKGKRKAGRPAKIAREEAVCFACKQRKDTRLCTYTEKRFCRAHWIHRGLKPTDVFWRDVRRVEQGSVVRVVAYWGNPTLSLFKPA
jgi:hypothetical protein